MTDHIIDSEVHPWRAMGAREPAEAASQCSEWELDCWSHLPNFPELEKRIEVLYNERMNLFCSTEDCRFELDGMFREEARDFWSRFEELSSFFGVPAGHLDPRSQFKEGWERLHTCGILISQLKYAINVAFCRHFGDLEEPEPIDFGLGLALFPPSFRDRLGGLRAEKKRFKKKTLYLMNTLFQGFKKGFLPLEPPAFAKTMRSHRKRLCETDGRISDDIANSIRRISRQFLNKFKAPQRESSSLLPSSSATIERSRVRGGGLGFLLDSYGRDPCMAEPDWLVGYVEERSVPRAVYAVGPNTRELKDEEFFHIRKRMREGETLPDVLPYGVLEPLKIRTITRPTVTTHFGLRGLQKALLSHLGTFPQFAIIIDSDRDKLKDHISSLIGDWTDDFDVQLETEAAYAFDPLSVFGGQSRVSRGGLFNDFVSGDYSAATDTVKSGATEVIWDTICERGVPSWQQEWGARTLLSSMIHYDEKVYPKLDRSGPWREWVPPCVCGDNCSGGAKGCENPVACQTNGQLMGHILSFLILCLINYCVWHVAMERRFKRIFLVDDLRDFGVRVNGDDVLFRADRRLYDCWRRTTSEFGFELSLGKNFYSRDICQINSQLYKVVRDFTGSVIDFERVAYMNFGLLTGRKKGMDATEALLNFSGPCGSAKKVPSALNDLSSVHKNFSEELLACPESLRPEMRLLQKKWFDRRFRSQLTSQQYSTLYLPMEMGGLGFVGEMPKKKFQGFDQLRSMFRSGTDALAEARLCFPQVFAESRLTVEKSLEAERPRLNVMDVVYLRPEKKLRVSSESAGRVSTNIEMASLQGENDDNRVTWIDQFDEMLID